MLLHGDRDTDLPYEQSVLMHDRLTERCLRQGLVPVHGGGHGSDADMASPAVKGAFGRGPGSLSAHVRAQDD